MNKGMEQTIEREDEDMGCKFTGMLHSQSE
jgi:hypothetical protein